MARGLVNRPWAQIGIDGHALHQRPIGLDEPGDPEALALARPGVLAQRLLGHATLARHLQPASQCGLRILCRLGHVLMVGMHPQLASRPVDDRGRLAVVVGVGMGAHDQAHVLQTQAALVERPFQVGNRARLVHTRIHQHDPVRRRQRECVAVGHAGPGQRKSQPPRSGDYALASSQLTSAPRIGHAWRR